MWMRILALSALLVSFALADVQKKEFQTYLNPLCVSNSKDGEQLINGQEYPLAQTMENFIALAEKFEEANSIYSLKNELFYFIRNYTYDNIEFTSLGDVRVYDVSEANRDVIKKLWEPDDSERIRLPVVNGDPFDDNERCSLFYMLSHSIIRTPKKKQARAFTNFTRYYNEIPFNMDEQYPIEIGVVAVKGSPLAVDLGRVLKGIYVGLRENRKISIETYEDIPKDVLSMNQERMIDPLYTLTLAEVITLATWRFEHSNRVKFPASEGWWVSQDPNTKEICPVLYRHKNDTMALYSQSTLRGAADGFILGRIVGDLAKKHTNLKLSQILRMYYSRSGISSRDDELGSMWASFCDRLTFLGPLDENIRDQVRLYHLLSSDDYTTLANDVDFAMNYYNDEKSSIFKIWDSDLANYCAASLTSNDLDKLPLESPLDIIAVLDTSAGDEFYRKQQLILGYMAKRLDLSLAGSKMTILTDQKEQPTTQSSSSGAIKLKSIVLDSHSASCVACSVVQKPKDIDASASEDEVIIAIDQLLEARKRNDSSKNGVEGKVVIYFNFEDENKSARPTSLQARVDRALKDLHNRHIDVTMFAVGKNTQVVKKYGRNDIAFVMSAIEDVESVVGKNLFNKVSAAPATLQYSDCVDGRSENSAIYEDFVSPNAIQHWEMPAKYFYKSGTAKIWFEAIYGPLKICHSRATVSPEGEKSTCSDIENGQKIEFVHKNPCKNFNDISCGPFYFSVIGVNNTDGVRQDCIDNNSENRCKTLEQIKFKVSHDGIRCNGSTGLAALPMILLFVTLVQMILSKRF